MIKKTKYQVRNEAKQRKKKIQSQKKLSVVLKIKIKNS